MHNNDQNMTSNQHPRPSMTPKENWESLQKSVADKIANETRALKEENVMLRQNMKKAEEIAAADEKEKNELQGQVKELREKVVQLEQAVDDKKKL